MRWRPFEIAAIVIGFMIWWPVGLAMLGFKLARSRGFDARATFEAMRNRFGGVGTSQAQAQWRPFATPASGNTAFDEWRKTEMERLEAERRKLDDARRDFSDYLDGLRKAKDREEFDRFMQSRQGGAGTPGPQA